MTSNYSPLQQNKDLSHCGDGIEKALNPFIQRSQMNKGENIVYLMLKAPSFAWLGIPNTRYCTQEAKDVFVSGVSFVQSRLRSFTSRLSMNQTMLRLDMILLRLDRFKLLI